VASSGGPPPDLPSSAPNVSDGFSAYPTNPPKAMSGPPPGQGSIVNVFSNAYYPPPTPLEQNPAWQEINRQLNATVQFNIAASPDYPAKLATLMAGNDLPDLILLNTGLGAAAALPQFLQAQCADLTPYLAGDAVKDYPNLAALPTAAWKNSASVLDGRVLTLPIHRPVVGVTMLFANSEIWDRELGATTVPQSADDFKRILTQLNRPQQNRWAIGAYGVGGIGVNYAVPTFAAMYGAPNNWVFENGKLTKDRETEQYRAAVGYTRDLVAAGLYHPNQASLTSPSVRNEFIGGHVAVLMDALIAWNDVWLRGLNASPQVPSRPLPPFPAQAGGTKVHHQAPGFQATTALKKASADRIKELLGIANWLASPFGSQEDLLLTYGLADVDYQLDAKGNPVPTSRGTPDSAYVPWRFIAQRPYVWYNASLPDYARVTQTAEKEMLSAGVADPTVGHYSATFYSRGRALEQSFVDGIHAIVAGSRPLSDYDQVVREWVAGGGDTIRREFTESLTKSS
jgi:putative aldouronate transport system substrate-binding protein